MSDDHVLRIADECCGAANVRAGREPDQVWQHRQFAAPNDDDNERR
jgi:hypothetical protein